ncbi:Protein FAR1-RELATED SEQUENCE 5 [Dichanthelium oligosanthes]|uniref:Protein FAR1-RELATED SEQUENCE 5 n=1 Tax=Dichanthelium oligosanthes TaxID=888268 RepID=A0A1E5WCY6_9POAL|nr:Protein FAR1-RELATED SEQUENCE 5 [Dichanthelium oligosanthes]
MNNDGYQTMSEFVCPRQAMIRLHRIEDDGWFISTYVKEHNHEFSMLDAVKKKWNSHKMIEQPIRDTVKYLLENNVTLSKLHYLMGSLYGSKENIPFTRRSLRTICAQIAREQRNDDIRKTLDPFRKIRAEDPGFQFSVELDNKKDQIKALIWTNGKGRSDYNCFGDVVTFDTTYNTNLYKMPFGLFVGVNNYFQSTILGDVFIRDEKAESFKWVFSEFLTLWVVVLPQTILIGMLLACLLYVAVYSYKITMPCQAEHHKA